MDAILATPFQMWMTFGIIFTAVVIYSIDRWSLEIVSTATLLALLLFFQFFEVLDPNTGSNLLSAEVLLSGFANPALISIIALLIVGQGMYQAGALEGPTRRLTQLTGNRPWVTIILILLVIAVVSAFLNNTPVAVMFIPILSAIAARAEIPVSKVMIPLSFMCILGGMTTLIGSSTNLLVAQSALLSAVDGAQRAELNISFFDFTVPGLVLAGVGAIYVLYILPRILPQRQSLSGELVGSSGKQYIAQIDITPGHPLIGVKSTAGLFPELKNMTVRMVQRREDAILPPFEDVELQLGDVVIVAATRKTLTEILASKENILSGMIDAQEAPRGRGGQNLSLIECVVAPGSRMIGRDIQQIGFRYQTGCIVLGIQRRSRMIRGRMKDIRLEAGDVLLIFGTRKNIIGLRANRDILPLEWSAEEVPDITFAFRARTIFGGVILAAASGLLPIVVAALLGAVAMIASGCLNIRQASRAFDRRIYLLVGAALAMGTSLEVTGGATYLAHSLVFISTFAGTTALLSAFFLLVALMTNVLSNNATAVLFTPIAVSLAAETGADPRAFVFAVIFAANCSFATPMSYQTNLLVMGPGHYQFVDFVKAGTPLIIIIWLTFTFFAPFYFSGF
ncbi:MAG: SLC13 family permease [Alphaproteobacteria bacterium]|nr:MAG: SLC13 family permease [Alphaproteobacteria bacterium]